MDKTAPKIKYAPRQKQFRSAKLTQAATHEETMQFKHVTLDLDGSVAILKLDHQEVMNAVSAAKHRGGSHGYSNDSVRTS